MNKWVSQVFWTLVEHSSIRVLDALLTIVLIQVFSTEQFGLFSIYQSWTGIALLFLPSLELVLYREFGVIKNEGRLAQELALYRNFNYFKLLVALIFAAALSLMPKPMIWSERLALVLLAFALPLSQAFYGFLREILRFEMKTRIVAVVSALQRAVLISGIVLIAWRYPHNAGAITKTALAIYVLFAFIWNAPVHRLFKQTARKPAPTLRQYSKRFHSLFSSIVLWIHLNGVLTQFIQTLDTFFLGNLGVALKTVGLYSITLKAANFFQVLPVALVNPFGVYLGRNSSQKNEAHEHSVLLKMTAAFLLLSVLLFAGGTIFADPILVAIGRGKIDASNLAVARVFFFWQLAGVLLLCVSHPISTYLGARYPLRQMSTRVFLPWLACSALIYGLSAYRGGALWAAYANVAVYAVFLALLSAFYFTQSPWTTAGKVE